MSIATTQSALSYASARKDSHGKMDLVRVRGIVQTKIITIISKGGENVSHVFDGFIDDQNVAFIILHFIFPSQFPNIPYQIHNSHVSMCHATKA